MRVLRFAVSVAGLVALATVLAAPPPARAQLQDSVSRIGAALARLQPGARIRVHSQQGWAEGDVEASSSSFVTLHVDKTSSVIPPTAMDSILVRHSHAGKGALIGAVVAGIPMAIFAAALTANPIGDAPPGNTREVIGAGFRGLLIGAAPGALLGAIIGGSSHYWSLAAP